VVVSDPLLTPNSNTCATLAPGASCVLTGTHTVTLAEANAGQVVNTGTGDSDQTDPDTDTETVIVNQDPALNTVKAYVSFVDNDASGDITLGDVLTYTVTVTNTGNVTLTNVTVSDPLLTPNSTTCATLAPGATCVLTGTHTVTLAEANAGQVVNTGTGDSDQTDPDTDTETVTVNQDPSLNTVKAMFPS